MNKIYNNLNIENLIKTDWFNQFDEYQQEQIKIGLKDNLDVSIYAKLHYAEIEMNEIRLGLKNNLDISIYVNKYIVWKQMNKINLGLEKQTINVLIYFAKTKYYLNKIKEKLFRKERN